MDNLYIERNTISHILHIIAEHMINEDNWILGDSLTNIIANIDNNQQRHLITIDNVFAVSLLILIACGTVEKYYLVISFELDYVFCRS